MIVVEDVGFIASWVDGGRRFAQKQGFSAAGALDWLNFELANALCGNPLSAPALEIIGGNVRLLIEQDCWVSASGATTILSSDGVEFPMYQTRLLRKNSILQVGAVSQGVVLYIAFAAEFDLKKLFGSVCAVSREKSGGQLQQGQGLRKNERFEGLATTYNDDSYDKFINTKISPALKSASTSFSSPGAVKQIAIHFSYQEDLFSQTQKALFLASDYTVEHLDKMGIRTSGQAIKCNATALQSQPIAFGAIQITGAGQPIIMRNERQTMGGYPIIATVSRLALAILAQLEARSKIRFVQTNIEQSRCDYLLMQTALSSIQCEARKRLAKK